jgi:hypothetical protein
VLTKTSRSSSTRRPLRPAIISRSGRRPVTSTFSAPLRVSMVSPSWWIARRRSTSTGSPSSSRRSMT